MRLTDRDGVEGWGEAAPARIYGETTETVLAALQTYVEHLPADPFHLEDIERHWEPAARGSIRPRAARCPPRCTIWSASGSGVPVYQLWGLDPARAPRSTFTIGIDTAEKLRQKVLEAEEYPILKIKLGTDRDVEILKTIRELTDEGAPGGRQHRLER